MSSEQKTVIWWRQGRNVVAILLIVFGICLLWAIWPKGGTPTATAVAAAVPTVETTVTTPLVTSGVGSPFPVLFQEQSTGKGAAFAYDIGVNPGQHGIVFGQFIQWETQKSGDIQNGCGLVVLESGFYRALYIVDGRYEIRDLPMGNEDFWKQKLAVDRAAEQADHYGCPDKRFEEIPVWKSPSPSPPTVVQSTQSQPATSTAPTTTPVQPAPATSAPTAERRPTGENLSLSFVEGESVYGWKIVLDDGRTCDGGKCYLPVAPRSGVVTSGVINPWYAEIPAKTNPWNP